MPRVKIRAAFEDDLLMMTMSASAFIAMPAAGISHRSIEERRHDASVTYRDAARPCRQHFDAVLARIKRADAQRENMHGGNAYLA